MQHPHRIFLFCSTVCSGGCSGTKVAETKKSSQQVFRSGEQKYSIQEPVPRAPVCSAYISEVLTWLYTAP